MTMRRASTLFALIFLSFTAFAQQGSITGKVADTSKKALGFATVTVFKAIDTSIITYRLSNPEGDFKVPNLPLNVQLRVLVT
jgi:hypothetical protein